MELIYSVQLQKSGGKWRTAPPRNCWPTVGQKSTVGRQSADTITPHTSKLKSVSSINHKRFINFVDLWNVSIILYISLWSRWNIQCNSRVGCAVPIPELGQKGLQPAATLKYEPLNSQEWNKGSFRYTGFQYTLLLVNYGPWKFWGNFDAVCSFLCYSVHCLNLYLCGFAVFLPPSHVYIVRLPPSLWRVHLIK